MSKRRYIGKGQKPAFERRRGRIAVSIYSEPRIDPALTPVFQQIGVPAPGPFIPDPFQFESIEKIKEFDVLVSAPTGSGKTWIALETIRSYLATGQRPDDE